MKTAEKPRLKPANENPWYCLATLYGEQSGEDIDLDLLQRNRRGWDEWRGGQNVEAISAAFAARMAATVALPDRMQRADFTFTHFEAPFIFQAYNSIEHTDFSSAKFSNYVNFIEVAFRNVSFRSATFSKNSTFTYARFLENTDFSSVTFLKDVDFSLAKFSKNTEFASARFSKANFSTTHFHSYLDFSSAHFKENADFRSTNFSEYANFSSTTFLNADFGSATFHQSADFASTVFKSSVYFTSSAFLKDADFRSAVFSKTADFVNAKFESITVFASARFEGQVPDFRGAKLHEATEWHDVHWPPKPQSKADAQNQVYAYEKLKLEMERLKKHVDEQAFFAKELRARRETYPAVSTDRILNSLYELSSNYGQKVEKPLLWLLLLFALGTGLFVTVPVSRGVAHLSLDRAAGLSFANIFSFLQKREMTSYSGPAQVIGAIEQIIGLILLFLLGLALRNNFRMK